MFVPTRSPESISKNGKIMLLITKKLILDINLRLGFCKLYRTMIFFVGCTSPSGLANFDFSHEGYFEDYIFKGKKDQIRECAQECKNTVNCTGFSYMYGGDISNIKNCFIYQFGTNVKNKIELDGESKAYIKCEGTYETAVHILKTIKFAHFWNGYIFYIGAYRF